MVTAIKSIDTAPLTLHFAPLLRKLNDEDFFEFCQVNREWRIERTSDGDIIIMAPTGGETGGEISVLSASSIYGSRPMAQAKDSIHRLGSSFPTAQNVRPTSRGFASRVGMR
jgi:hypothetical protein